MRTSTSPPLTEETPEAPAEFGRKDSAGRPGRLRTNPILLVVGQIGVGLLLIGVWQAVVSLGLIDDLVARTPAEVWRAFRELLSSGQLWPNLWSTFSASMVAFFLASVTGIVIGVGLGLSPTIERLTAPFLSLFNSIPRTAFAPVFIVYFGIGQASKIALAFTVVVFIMIINARAGIRDTDPDIMTMARVMGTSRRNMFVQILLPSAVPSIFAGLWLGLIYAQLGVVTSEIISAEKGMGQLISRYSASFNLEAVYALVLILGVIGMVLNAAMASCERYVLRWQNS